MEETTLTALTALNLNSYRTKGDDSDPTGSSTSGKDVNKGPEIDKGNLSGPTTTQKNKLLSEFLPVFCLGHFTKCIPLRSVYQ